MTIYLERNHVQLTDIFLNHHLRKRARMTSYSVFIKSGTQASGMMLK